MEVPGTLSFSPNRVVIFIKTFNFRHTARPMPGKGTDAMRRTAAMNSEAVARVDK
jgi:hypothetical protein